MYKAKVIRWGNSQAISLPKALMEDIDFHIGESVCVELTSKHEIIIRKDERLPLESNNLESTNTGDNKEPEILKDEYGVVELRSGGYSPHDACYYFWCPICRRDYTSYDLPAVGGKAFVCERCGNKVKTPYWYR